jgi:hypothetical protein
MGILQEEFSLFGSFLSCKNVLDEHEERQVKEEMVTLRDFVTCRDAAAFVAEEDGYDMTVPSSNSLLKDEEEGEKKVSGEIVLIESALVLPEGEMNDNYFVPEEELLEAGSNPSFPMVTIVVVRREPSKRKSSPCPNDGEVDVVVRKEPGQIVVDVMRRDPSVDEDYADNEI